MRRIKFFDVTTDLRLVFLTNDFASPALTIARLYKLRWQIELFFKWIKQHLRIKAFYGTSPNAMKTQIWIALSTYLLIAIIRKRLYLELPLLHNSPGPECLALRENPNFTGLSGHALHYSE